MNDLKVAVEMVPFCKRKYCSYLDVNAVAVLGARI